MQGNSGVRRIKKLLRDVVRFFCASPRCIINYFVHGLIIIIPLVITLWVIIWLFNLIDGMLSPFLGWFFGRPMPGLGFVIIVVSIVLIGYFGIRVGHRKAFDFLEARIKKIPIAGAIYGSTRQILEGFTTTTSSKFLEVVFMEFPRKGIYTVGLVTSEIRDRNGKNIFNVFIPTAPNPTSGFLQIVPESDVVRTSMSVSDAMKLIISAGKISRKDIADMLVQVPELDTKVKSD